MEEVSSKLFKTLEDSGIFAMLSDELSKATKKGLSNLTGEMVMGVKSIFNSVVGIIGAIAGSFIMFTLLMIALFLLALATIAYLIVLMVSISSQ